MIEKECQIAVRYLCISWLNCIFIALELQSSQLQTDQTFGLEFDGIWNFQAVNAYSLQLVDILTCNLLPFAEPKPSTIMLF